MSSKHLKVALDIEQDSVLLEESIETIDFVPTEGKDIGRIPILTTVFFFLVVVIINRNWNPQNSFQSYSELSTNCLSREYGPVKEGYDLVSRTRVNTRISSGQLSQACRHRSHPLTFQKTKQVAYHSLEPGSRGIKGDSAFSSLYEGYTFWFTSDLNREAFEVNPRRYLPMVSATRNPHSGNILSKKWPIITSESIDLNESLSFNIPLFHLWRYSVRWFLCLGDRDRRMVDCFNTWPSREPRSLGNN